jgi:DNA invertase Pin-like site-specific DNA recombinase
VLDAAAEAERSRMAGSAGSTRRDAPDPREQLHDPETMCSRGSGTSRCGRPARGGAAHRAADSRGWVSPRDFIDLGHSGANASRTALDELRRAGRAGEVRAVMVAGLDRLGRSLRDLLHLLDELTAAGCAVISLRESIDLTTPSGRLLVQLIGAMAEFERQLITERVRAGIARVKATGKTRSGKPIGRPRRAVDLDWVRELRVEGRSWRAIAVALKVPSRTIRTAMQRAERTAA